MDSITIIKKKNNELENFQEVIDFLKNNEKCEIKVKFEKAFNTKNKFDNSQWNGFNIYIQDELRKYGFEVEVVTTIGRNNSFNNSSNLYVIKELISIISMKKANTL